MLHKIKILAALILTFTIVSCSDSIVNNPETVQNENIILQKKGRKLQNDNPPTTITKTINGKIGGVINLTGLYIGLDLRIITINANLVIPPGAFEGTKDITLTADWQTPGIICEPSMKFNIPLTLDLRFVGIDILSLFQNDDIIFAYLESDGIRKPINYDGIDINLLSGLLGVRKAKLEHFSRYGFSR